MLVKVKDHPIIFNGDMVCATLEDRKTQTRRVIKPQPCPWVEKIEYDKDRSMCILHGHEMGMKASTYGFDGQPVILCPYGQPGDRLWVRETWRLWKRRLGGKETLQFKADSNKWMIDPGNPWESPIFMPRKYSRITLEITDVRVERLQEINYIDTISEGIVYEKPNLWGFPAKFIHLWNSIHKKEHRWEDNPWVWVVEFKRC